MFTFENPEGNSILQWDFSNSPFNSIIVRLSGEISIKSEGVRRYWERKLLKYIKTVIGDTGVVRHTRGRIYVDLKETKSSSLNYILKKLVKIFGVSSISPAIKCKSDLEEIKSCAEKLTEFYINNFSFNAENSFAIICKKSLSPLFGTTEVRVEVGAHIKDRFGLRVDLSNPDIPIHVEVRKNYSFVFPEFIRGYGGLPFGVQDKLIALLSGGPDSTLAAWLALRRGSPIIPVYFDFGEEQLRTEARNRVIKVSNILFKDWTPFGTGKLYIVPFQTVVSAILKHTNEKKYSYVLLKRLMYCFAFFIADREKAMGVVSGEIIGEHASQTVWNLNVISLGSKYQIIRPVACFDKADVFKTLKSIDEHLFEASSKSIEPCKFLTSIKPTTMAELEKILEYEKNIMEEINDKVDKILEEASIIEF